jgi:hypothetical protein
MIALTTTLAVGEGFIVFALGVLAGAIYVIVRWGKPNGGKKNGD